MRPEPIYYLALESREFGGTFVSAVRWMSRLRVRVERTTSAGDVCRRMLSYATFLPQQHPRLLSMKQDHSIVRGKHLVAAPRQSKIGL